MALMRGFARSVETADVTGEGTLDVMRYGQPLRARSLVGVRGAGFALDGMHYVDKRRIASSPASTSRASC